MHDRRKTHLFCPLRPLVLCWQGGGFLPARLHKRRSSSCRPKTTDFDDRPSENLVARGGNPVGTSAYSRPSLEARVNRKIALRLARTDQKEQTSRGFAGKETGKAGSHPWCAELLLRR